MQGSVEEDWLFNDSMRVFQDQEPASLMPQHCLFSLSSAPVIAMVDRIANFDNTARDIVGSRLSFGGRSPYAPDLVLVNEFVKKKFLQAVLREMLAAEDKLADPDTRSFQRKSNKRERVQLDKLREASGARIVTQTSRGTVVDIYQRSLDILGKDALPLLKVHAVSNLDDCIDFVSRSASGPAKESSADHGRSEKQLLAAYYFGEPKAGKYFVQSVCAQVAFVNHIPVQLLGLEDPLSNSRN